MGLIWLLWQKSKKVFHLLKSRKNFFFQSAKGVFDVKRCEQSKKVGPNALRCLLSEILRVQKKTQFSQGRRQRCHYTAFCYFTNLKSLIGKKVVFYENGKSWLRFVAKIIFRKVPISLKLIVVEHCIGTNFFGFLASFYINKHLTDVYKPLLGKVLYKRTIIASFWVII